MEGEMKKDEDFVYFDKKFVKRLRQWTGNIKSKAREIDELIDMFEQKLKEKPTGMFFAYSLIAELNASNVQIERCQTMLSIELMKLKGLHIQQMMIEGAEKAKEDKGEGYS